MSSSCAHQAITQLAGITIPVLIMCSAMSFPVARFILTENIFALCPTFNLKAFDRQQLYKIWPYMGSIIIFLFVYNPIYSSSNSTCSKVHLNINVRMYVAFRPLFLSMKSISCSQCVTSVHEVWSDFGARTISLPFEKEQITTMNNVIGNRRRLLLAILLEHSPKSLPGRMLPRHPLTLASLILIANFYKLIATQCGQIHSVLSKVSNSSQSSNVTKIYATAVPEWSGPSWSWLKWFCPQMKDRCCFLRNPATHTFFHLLNALELACPILLANCFKEKWVCFRLTGSVVYTLPKSDKSSLSSCIS